MRGQCTKRVVNSILPAQVYSQSGHPEKAIDLLEDKLETGLDDLNIVNMLCELLIGKGDYKKGVDLVTRIAKKKGGENNLPIDLIINQVSGEWIGCAWKESGTDYCS